MVTEIGVPPEVSVKALPDVHPGWSGPSRARWLARDTNSPLEQNTWSTPIGYANYKLDSTSHLGPLSLGVLSAEC
jgi:hypothetical protein